MTKSVNKTILAAYIMMLGGTGHLLGAVFGTRHIWLSVIKNGWWNQVPPPWTSGQLSRQIAFWSVWGGFAIPVILLGTLLIYIGNNKIKPPKFIGVALLCYALATAMLLPAGGFWLLIVSAILLIAD